MTYQDNPEDEGCGFCASIKQLPPNLLRSAKPDFG